VADQIDPEAVGSLLNDRFSGLDFARWFELLRRARAVGAGGDLVAVASELWGWLAAPEHRGGGAGDVAPTLALAVLRGALLDLLATGDVERATDAVQWQFALMNGAFR